MVRGLDLFREHFKVCPISSVLRPRSGLSRAGKEQFSGTRADLNRPKQNHVRFPLGHDKGNFGVK